MAGWRRGLPPGASADTRHGRRFNRPPVDWLNGCATPCRCATLGATQAAGASTWADSTAAQSRGDVTTVGAGSYREAIGLARSMVDSDCIIARLYVNGNLSLSCSIRSNRGSEQRSARQSASMPVSFLINSIPAVVFVAIPATRSGINSKPFPTPTTA